MEPKPMDEDKLYFLDTLKINSHRKTISVLRVIT